MHMQRHATTRVHAPTHISACILDFLAFSLRVPSERCEGRNRYKELGRSMVLGFDVKMNGVVTL